MPKLHGIIVEKKPLQIKKRSGTRKRSNPVLLKGYPGLKNTASIIAQFIPSCSLFVEPFAGLGRIGKLVNADRKVFNDLSEFALTYLRKHFKNYEIEELDFMDCINVFDSKNTFFFFDPPWYDDIYKNNPLPYLNKNFREYYKDLKKRIEELEGDWMIAGSIYGPLTKWEYYHKIVESKKKAIFGYKAKTLLVSNKPFTNHWQKELEFGSS